MQYITRTFTGFNIHFAVMELIKDKDGNTVMTEDGQPKTAVTDKVVYEQGTAATKEAAIRRAVRRMAGKGILTSAEYVEELRGLDIDTFFTLSKPMKRPPSQQKQPAVE